MKYFKRLFLFLIFSFSAYSQMNRITYNNQELFLSGSNLAWVSYANDIGPGNTDFERFADVMLQSHDHGGNALRIWLHTTGTTTPEYNDTGLVVGPGEGTIEDLRAILDLAWEREIGMDLCLWSFGMLDIGDNPDVLNRNRKLLLDTNYTRAYINNCLIPMVDSLKGHPGIITWEIINEPEGMTSEFGWTDSRVPMSTIQRFVNLCAGAIHRTDPNTLVTSGAQTFQTLTNVASAIDRPREIAQLRAKEKEDFRKEFNQLYNTSLTQDEYNNYIENLARIENFNYYADAQLIAAGGDPDGILDFYSVHYYLINGSGFSPFKYSADYWQLTKPVVVAEFAMQENHGVGKEVLFDKLYQFDYAGAMAWSWTDQNLSSPEDMLTGMQYMWDNHRSDVEIIGIAGEWPHITITNPDTNAIFSDTSDVEIVTDAYDVDGYVDFVEFFANDSLIGRIDTIPFIFLWSDIPPGNYILQAAATDNEGYQRSSNIVPIQVGTPPMTRLEAEDAERHGSGMSIMNDPTASGGAYLDIKSNDTTNNITWTLPDVPEAGNYNIVFGFKLAYDSPKYQYVNVNGVRVDTIGFVGNTTSWLETGTNIDLVQGENTIQMQLFWGWVQLDYLGVPKDIVSAVGDNQETPLSFSLEQNYPNPFNPVTNIRYTLANTELVKLSIYDILGRKIVTLINETQNVGAHIVEFDAGNLASGVYFYRIEAGSFNQVNKMMLLK